MPDNLKDWLYVIQGVFGPILGYLAYTVQRAFQSARMQNTELTTQVKELEKHLAVEQACCHAKMAAIESRLERLEQDLRDYVEIRGRG